MQQNDYNVSSTEKNEIINSTEKCLKELKTANKWSEILTLVVYNAEYIRGLLNNKTQYFN